MRSPLAGNWQPRAEHRPSSLANQGEIRSSASTARALRPNFGSPAGGVFSALTLWRAGCAIAIQQHNRRHLADCPVGASLIVVLSPILQFLWASARLKNQCAFRHSARKRPLNASMNALSVGLPGREKSSVTPR